MSFRYTNDLITTFKQKALMSHYTSAFLFSRTFNGYCAGVTAKVNSSCELMELTVDEKAKATFHEAAGDDSSAATAAGDDVAAKALASARASTTNVKLGPVDSKKLAKAIKMAIWDATRKVKAAKEEYYHLSVKNARLNVASRETTGEAPEATEAELATIRDFSKYGLSTDAALLAPHPWDSLRDRSPYHTMVNSATYNDGLSTTGGKRSDVLAKEFSLTKPMTLGDILPEYRAAFLSYPAGAKNATIVDTAAGASSSNASVTAEQRAQSAALAATADALLARQEAKQIKAAAALEEANDEISFWTRVEAIRKGQQAVLGASLNKRPYKDQAGAVPDSTYDEKVSLRFIS